MTVVAEHMGSGSKVAAPIAKNIINLALRNIFKCLILIIKFKNLNWFFIFLVGFLSFVGLVMIYSATFEEENKIFNISCL